LSNTLPKKSWRKVTIPNVDHLLDQAERLITPTGRGAPRQVDLRRAISSAYYALFHEVCVGAADQLVGRAKQSQPFYALVYRSIDHRALRQLCEDLAKPTLPPKYARYVPSGFPLLLGIGFFRLPWWICKRDGIRADYDPSIRLSVLDARMAIRTARRALILFRMVRRDRRIFLMLLLFPPR
jgi:hypothetical protein